MVIIWLFILYGLLVINEQLQFICLQQSKYLSTLKTTYK